MSEMFQMDDEQTRAYLMINCEYGSEEHVLDELRTFPEIKDLTLTIGPHDILALIHASSTDHLREIIYLRIRRIPSIHCTTTLVCTQPGV